MKQNLTDQIDKWKKNKSPLNETRKVLISQDPMLPKEAIIRLMMLVNITHKSQKVPIKVESEFQTQGQSGTDKDHERGDINLFTLHAKAVEQNFEKEVQQLLS